VFHKYPGYIQSLRPLSVLFPQHRRDGEGFIKSGASITSAIPMFISCGFLGNPPPHVHEIQLHTTVVISFCHPTANSESQLVTFMMYHNFRVYAFGFPQVSDITDIDSTTRRVKPSEHIGERGKHLLSDLG
jgi:hypothetical protein